MKKLLLLLGFLAGAAQAHDEYYTLSSAVTTNLVGAPGNLPLTVTGWIETDGFGTTGHPRPNAPDTLFVAGQINLTYDGVTETMSTATDTLGLVGYFGLVATSKGLFCNFCEVYGAGYPWFAMGSNSTAGVGGVTYQYVDTGANGTTPGILNFNTPYLKNNFRIGNAPTTTMPTTAAMAAPEMDPGQAGAALMLLVGTALVLKGRRRG